MLIILGMYNLQNQLCKGIPIESRKTVSHRFSTGDENTDLSDLS